MSNKKSDIQSDLTRGRSLKKKLEVTDEEAKKVVKKVTVEEKPMKQIRTTMDLPENIHTAIKVKAAQERLSLKDYIVRLVKKDLNIE